MEGKIVITSKTKDGLDFIIRYPTKDDAEVMWEYINLLSKEQTFISIKPRQ